MNGINKLRMCKVDSSSYPISYHGEFHYRSGATKQQLTGIALSEFITRKTGIHWEDATVDDISVDDLDDESFKIFREVHDSISYNPDIANVFFRAGFIENWGQGIQKICKECRDIGADLPEYELVGTTLRIRFKALPSALIDRPIVPKHQSTGDNGALESAMGLRIIEILKEEPGISQEDLADRLDTTRRIIQKHINVLKEADRIERVGGKRYGHWEIRD